MYRTEAVAMAKAWSVSCFVLLSVCQFISGHVRLTFPPARQYALDFLDNIRTEPPCGMPRNLPRTTSLTTALQAGRKYNFTWHMAYPHKGGFRIELLRGSEIVAALTPVTATNAFVQGDATAETYEVEIPRFISECTQNCSVRILRQATEWAVTGDPYEFTMWSCADVTIAPVTQTSFQQSCSSQGQWQANTSATNVQTTITDINQIQLPGGTCICRAGFYGGSCQFSNECEVDNDCGSSGVCDFVNGTSYPRKMCFCKHTYFGPKCGKNNADKIKIDQINFDQYTRLPGTPPDVGIYWRVYRFDNEIEFALRIKTQSWVGIGWRPSYLTSSCREFPTNATDPDPLNGPTIEEVTRQGAYQQDAVWGHASFRDEVSALSRIRRSGGEQELHHVADDRVVENVHHHRMERDVGEKLARQEKDAEWATGEWVPSRQVLDEGYKGSSRSIHPMDCTDMVVGFARGETVNIQDYFTRDRSTPRPDAFYGGADNLIAADGYERNGFTVMVFRRSILLTGSSNTDQADYNITSRMQLIWAYGQNPAQELYKHDPPSGLSTRVSNPQFYANDEFKYHGSGGQRAAHSVDLFADEEASAIISKCKSEWLFPKNCNRTNGTCDFAVSWSYNATTDELNFDLLTRTSDRWTGIGFRKDVRSAPFTDGVVIYAGTSGQFVGDVHWNGTSIVADQRQDVHDIALSNVQINNKAYSRILFSRKRLTGDDPGQDLPLPEATEECVYMSFPIMGGEFRSSSSSAEREFQMFPPEFFPHTTQKKVCFGVCSGFSNAFYQIEIDVNAGSFSGNGQPGSVDFGLKMKEVADNIMSGLDRVRTDANDTTLPLRTFRAVRLTRPANSTNGMMIRAVALLEPAGRDPNVAAQFLYNRLDLARERGFYSNFQLTNNSFTFAKVSVVSGGFYGWPRRDLGQKQINDLIFLFTIGALGLTLLLQGLCNVRKMSRKGGNCVPAL